MFPGILRLEDFNLGNIKFKNEDEITIKLKVSFSFFPPVDI